MALPDYIIIGTQRGGTTSMMHWLRLHPGVLSPGKEVHFFDSPPLPVNVLGRQLGKRFPDCVAGYKAPNYLVHPDAPKRVRAARPNVKLIVLLRNPVDRAYSHWALLLHLGQEKRAFKDAINAGPSLPYDKHLGGDVVGYLYRGHYAEQIRRWREHFPEEQFLFLRSESVFADPRGGFDRVCDFLGLERYPVRLKAYGQVAPVTKLHWKTRKSLGEYFEPYNQDLYDLISEEFGVNNEWE